MTKKCERVYLSVGDDVPLRLAYGTDHAAVDVARKQPKTSRWSKVALGAGLLVMGVTFVSLSLPASNKPPVVDGQDAAKTNDEDDPYAAFKETMHNMIDAGVDPCENFYRYACGGWLKSATIPDDANTIDTSFTVVADRNAKIIDDIMRRRPPLIGPMYESCVKGKNADPEAIATISRRLQHIHNLTSAGDVVEYAGKLFALTNTPSFLELEVAADSKNATLLVLNIGQGGLTFPSKEYYTEDHKSHKYSSLFVDYVKALGRVKAFAKHNISRFADHVLDLEAKFADASLTNADLRDPWSTYNPMSLDQVATRFPYVTKYLQGAGFYDRIKASETHILVPTPEFFDAQTKILDAVTDLRVLKSYVSFHLIDTQSVILGEYFRQASHEFHGVLSGLERKQNRDDFCMDVTESILGDYVGQYYLDRVWDPATKAAAQRLVQEIEGSMDQVLQHESWLDDATRAQALDKLHHVFNLVGGPDALPELPFEISPTDFWSNVMHFKQLAFQGALDGVGASVDPDAWAMTASTVNAYYDPSENKMVFPAAIMQAPFYSAHHLPDVANYARIGMVMGHELSHGFDDQGRNYDGQGNLHVWWSAFVSHTYDVKAKCLVDQYSSFPVRTLDGKALIGHINGQLTLGENIADNGGLKLAYMAYLASKKAAPATPHEKTADDKLYFLSFAQGWCEKRSDAYAELLLTLDPHSPGKWRVNGPLMNSQLFADTFQCPVGTPMNPKDKCVVW
ncbi:Aste57867_14501 [Aphanomyces stellatus]|uniref:Aste57867_14501 protein n=1 Tax=Aphanomyces stellatus TaxID=120398 RepID=A0A485L0T3_9STRA|nr:hypothetical protein As57867_014447 [Aphanomyces stellatus]VFT91323.1 Aste57867_14501 [Aphanomyces stellatus]